MWEHFRYRVCMTLILTLITTASNADQSSISLNQAIVKTIQQNPELVSFGYQIQVQEGLLQQAALSPNPELKIEFENFLGTGDFNGVDALETTFSIGWVFERAVQKQRVNVAQASVSLFNTQAKIAQMDAAAETARRFLECLSNQERLRLANQSVELAEKTIVAIQKRVNASKAPKAELARAQADLVVKQLAQEDVQHEIKVANRKLAAQWGENSLKFDRVSGSLYVLPKTEPFKDLKERIELNPTFERLVSQRRVNEAELRLAEAMNKPQWQLSTGVRRFEEQNDQALVIDFTVPLNFKNRNQGKIAATNAKIAQVDADTKVTSALLRTQLFELYEELQHSIHQTIAYKDVIIPAFTQAAQDSQYAYESGRYSYLEWQAVQSNLLNAKKEYLNALIHVHLYVIEIERITGVEVVDATHLTRNTL